jgi:hypothetical protein
VRVCFGSRWVVFELGLEQGHAAEYPDPRGISRQGGGGAGRGSRAVIWRTRVLPRWLAGLAVIEAAINVAELAGLAAAKGTDAGGYAAGAGPVLWVAWAAALAVACR